MGGRYQSSDERLTIEAEAARLHLQAQTSDAEEDWNAAYAWVAANPAHGVAFAKAEAGWALTERLRESPPPIGPEAIAGPAGRLEARLEPLLSRRSMAAMIAITLFAMSAIIGIQKWSAVDRYRTAIGQERMVRLADGSMVHLNTDSTVEVALHDGQRTVRLLRGEARFDVAHDRNRPFIVQAGDSTLRAVGTAFTVRLRSELTELTVIEGQVAVRDGPSAALTVRAGNAAAIRGGAIATTPLEPRQIAQRTAWQTGVIAFDGETLAQAVEEFNRYRRVPLVIGDPQIASVRIGGTFRADSSDRFVAALAQGFEIRSVASRDAIILLPAGNAPALHEQSAQHDDQ